MTFARSQEVMSSDYLEKSSDSAKKRKDWKTKSLCQLTFVSDWVVASRNQEASALCQAAVSGDVPPARGDIMKKRSDLLSSSRFLPLLDDMSDLSGRAGGDPGAAPARTSHDMA
jgi:hypothetical protein